ncbi:type II toxin-antitoxin system ParD family antitoxin [Roseomonas nepalensis]|uniref:Type II toxin-antitoxin system ParD family antitoxin n=1 Tax=Muricoccus nepalensis TaxID=1854500 RepID=A0A502FTA9_9PROT|nr:type II toxin-antitoxin system ParD family antitoxin [Roseomonas nepalensis]
MAAKHSRHIALTGSLARYVDDRIARGDYASASEMVRAGLRLLIEQDETRAAETGRAEREVSRPRRQDP